MTEFVLYNASQSTCSQRVRFVLNARKVGYEERKLDLFGGDQLKPEYLRINPNGLVPTLVHDGQPIVDSSVIMEYLEEVLPDAARFTPADPLARARMRSMMHYIDEVPAPAIRVPSYNLAFLPHFQAMSEEEFLAVAESKPLRKEFILKMGRTGFPREDMDQALDRLRRAIGRVDDWLAASGGPFLTGDAVTLADISLMPIVVRMDDINLNTMWADRPAVQAWLDEMRAQPVFAQTYYFGSLLTEKYPHLARLRNERPETAALT